MAESRSRSKRVCGQMESSTHTQIFYWGNTTPSSDVSNDYQPHLCYDQVCVDETHSGPPFREGGPLDIHKPLVNYGSDVVDQPLTTVYKTSWAEYKLGFTGLMSQPTPLSSTHMASLWANYLYGLSDSTMTALGTEGWRRCTPLKPQMDLNQTIGELKDFRKLVLQTRQLLRDLFRKGSVSDLMRWIASGHLTWSFAIAPIIDDLIEMGSLSERLLKTESRIKRLNGKTRKCSRTLREKSWNESGSVVTSGGLFPTLPSSPWTNQSMLREETLDFKRKVWIEGRFGFYIPWNDQPTWMRDVVLTRLTTGIDLSLIGILRTIYQLTPWTWLADWATSVGDILANMVSIHNSGVFCKYAYVMAESELTFTANQAVSAGNGSFNHNVRGCWKRIRKQRIEASPFGFGIDTSDFTAWQSSILAALGLTRGLH